MKIVPATNIRVGPGVYLVLKNLSEKSGVSMGAWANFLVGVALVNTNTWKSFPPEISKVLSVDVLSAMGDLFKAMGMEAAKDINIADLYQRLLAPNKG